MFGPGGPAVNVARLESVTEDVSLSTVDDAAVGIDVSMLLREGDGLDVYLMVGVLLWKLDEADVVNELSMLLGEGDGLDVELGMPL